MHILPKYQTIRHGIAIYHEADNPTKRRRCNFAEDPTGRVSILTDRINLLIVWTINYGCLNYHRKALDIVDNVNGCVNLDINVYNADAEQVAEEMTNTFFE